MFSLFFLMFFLSSHHSALFSFLFPLFCFSHTQQTKCSVNVGEKVKTILLNNKHTHASVCLLLCVCFLLCVCVFAFSLDDQCCLFRIKPAEGANEPQKGRRLDRLCSLDGLYWMIEKNAGDLSLFELWKSRLYTFFLFHIFLTVRWIFCCGPSILLLFISWTLIL